MPDIFNRTTDAYGGSFAADRARITFPAMLTGGADTGLLVQNMSLNYSQQLTRLFEIGSPNVYLVSGRTSGGMQISRVIGPRKISKEFYQTYGDVCNARTNTLHFTVETGCDGAQVSFARAAFTAHFVVITGIGISTASADLLINEALQASFSSFLYN